MGHYLDFVFDANIPSQEELAVLLQVEGLEELEPWDKKDEQGVEHHYRDFKPQYGLPGVVTVFDTGRRLDDGGACAAQVRFPWALDPETYGIALLYLLELGSKLGFKLEDDRYLSACEEDVVHAVKRYLKGSRMAVELLGAVGRRVEEKLKERLEGPSGPAEGAQDGPGPE